MRLNNFGRAEEPQEPTRGMLNFAAPLILGFAGTANLINLSGGLSETLPVVFLSIVLALGLAVLLPFSLMFRDASKIPAWIMLLSGFLPGALIANLNPYGLEKLVGLGFGVLLVIMSAISIRRERSAMILFLTTAGVGLIASILLVTSGATTSGGRVTIEGLNPLGPARAAGCAVVVIGTLGVYVYTRDRVLGLMLLAFCSLPITALLMAETRGPLWSAVVAVGFAVIAATAAGIISLARALPIYICAGIVVAWGAFALLAENSRVITFESKARLALIQDAVSLILKHPAGVGWGNFSEALGAGSGSLSGGGFRYPHNILLESASEGGLLALACLIGVLVLAFAGLWRKIHTNQNKKSYLLALALLSYAILNSFVSSDLSGNRLLWVALGSAIGLGLQHSIRRFGPRSSRLPGGVETQNS